MFHQYSVVANEGLRRKQCWLDTRIPNIILLSYFANIAANSISWGQYPANMRNTQRKRIKPVTSRRCISSGSECFLFLDRHFTCAFGRGRVTDVLRVRDMSGEKCVTFCWRKKFTNMKIVGSMMRIDRRSKRCYCTQSTNKNTENFQFKTCFFNYEG